MKILSCILRYSALFFACITFLLSTYAFAFANESHASTNAVWTVEPLVSFDFDDGNKSAYEFGLPIINAAGFKATEYIITQWVGAPNFVTKADVLDMQTRGNEIGAHTRHHAHFQHISTQDAIIEVEGSRRDLLDMGVLSVSAFAYPFGERATTTAEVVKNAGFKMARLTAPGINDRNVNPYSLQRFPLNASTTPAATFKAIDDAISNKKWLILVLHHINQDNSQSISDVFLQQIVDYVKQKNVRVVTATEGYDLVFATASQVVATSTATSSQPSYNTATSSPSANTDKHSENTPIRPLGTSEATNVPTVNSGEGRVIFVPSPISANVTTVPSATSSTPTTTTKTTLQIQSGLGQVLGASAYFFSRQLKRGMRGNDVIELQKTLISSGLLRFNAPSGYFGTLTEGAIKKYQKANGLSAVGNVGPKTLALLNSSSHVASAATKHELIELLKKEVQRLLNKINELNTIRA